MISVEFHDHNQINDEQLIFVVIIAVFKQQLVLCKHKQRRTYECPGGHREAQETIEEAARRELYEETGASDYTLEEIGIYSVKGKTIIEESSDQVRMYGVIYFADIVSFTALPESEIQQVQLFQNLPELNEWTYPMIQPRLIQYVKNVINKKTFKTKVI